MYCALYTVSRTVLSYTVCIHLKIFFKFLHGIFKQKENFSLHFVCNLYDTKNYVTPLSGSPILFNETQLLKTFSQKQLEVWSWACIQISNIDLFYSILIFWGNGRKCFKCFTITVGMPKAVEAEYGSGISKAAEPIIKMLGSPSLVMKSKYVLFSTLLE